MPAFTYEGMFLLDSAKAATAWDDTVKHVHDILTKHQSEIVASRQWDEPTAGPYTIDGHKKGTYLLTYFKDRRVELLPRRSSPTATLSHDVSPAGAGPESPPEARRSPGQSGDDIHA